ncbi:MAG: addiction module protein [Pseudomonadota bacterium]
MKIADFKNMSATKRLQLMEALWDSFLYEDGKIESPKWHEKILEERKINIANGNAKFISLEALKASRNQ